MPMRGLFQQNRPEADFSHPLSANLKPERGQSFKKPKCRCCADHICHDRPGELDSYPRKPERSCKADNGKNACNEKQLFTLDPKIERKQRYGQRRRLRIGKLCIATSTPDWRFGWAAGGGAEARLFDSNWLVRVEYLHYDFGDSGSFSHPNAAMTAIGASYGVAYEPVSFTSGHLTVDVVRAGLSYKFGGLY